MLVRWIPREEGWIKVNTDGTMRREDNCITADGVIQSCNGEWLNGLIANAGVGSVIASCNRAVGDFKWS